VGTTIVDTLGLCCTLYAEYLMTGTFAFDGVVGTDEADGAFIVLKVRLEHAERLHCKII
jgi:hypothetical protein